MTDGSPKPLTTNYAGNSHRATEPSSTPEPAERSKLDSVVTGKVVQRRPSLGSKMREAFVGDDISSVKNYLFVDVLVPALKNTVADLVTQGIERLVFGESRSRSSRTSVKTNYGQYSDPGRAAPTRAAARALAPANDYGVVILEHRSDAESVLDQMLDALDKYRQVTVADLLDLVNTSSEYTDNHWGWRDLSSARVRQHREGWLLDLPRPISLQR